MNCPHQIRWKPLPATYKIVQSDERELEQPTEPNDIDVINRDLETCHDQNNEPSDGDLKARSGSIESVTVNTGYNPPWLRKEVQICFAILWALIVASMQLILSVSQARQGLTQSSTNLPYLWTYGPTAFFVIVVAIWRKVDFNLKIVQPWAELAQGPVSASKTMSLNYVEPFQLLVLWRAIRAKHIAVACSILTFRLVDPNSGLIPAGTEWTSDEEIKNSKMWNGHEFCMGWWVQDTGEYDSEYDPESMLDEDTTDRVVRHFRIDAKPKLE